MGNEQKGFAIWRRYLSELR